MKVLKIIGIIILVILVLGFITILILPDEVHMKRSVTIDASTGEVYRELATLKNFNEWSPWAKLDTTATYTHEGPVYGVGAKMSWKSDSTNVGSGSMEIVEVNSGSLVKTAMKFEGYDSSPFASFIIEPEGDGTKVSWTYDETDISGMAKIFGAMMDNFLGPDYEKGLNALKERMESAPESTEGVQVASEEPFEYIGISSKTAMDMAMINSMMAQSYGTLMDYTATNGIEMSGFPLAFYTEWEPESVSFTCAVPVAQETPDMPKDVVRATYDGGLTAQLKYMGDYSNLETAHEAVLAYLDWANYEMTGAPWEEYITDPMQESDTSKWLTVIYYPVQ